MNDNVLMSLLLSNLRMCNENLARAKRLYSQGDIDYWWGKVIAQEEVLHEYVQRHSLNEEGKELMSLIDAYRKVYGND